MHLKVITPPLHPVVSLAEAYEHLRWDTETETTPGVGSPPGPDTEAIVYPLEAMITRNIATATQQVEATTRRSLCQRELMLCASTFSEFDGAQHSIELPMPPVFGIVSVEYYDSTNTLVAVDVADYFITDSVVPRLGFVTGFSVPTTYARDDAVQVTYLAGYEPEYTGSPLTTNQALYAANVPERLKDAVLLTLQLFVDRFDPVERTAMLRARDWLLADFIIYSV